MTLLERAAAVWRVFERYVLRTLVTIFVAYAFTVVLMTASAQQRVTAMLDERPDAERIDYSSAWSLVQDAEQQQKDLTKLLAEQEVLENEEQAARHALRDAETTAAGLWNRFSPVAGKVMALPGCGLAESTDRLAIWAWVDQCSHSETLPVVLRRQLVALAESQPNFEQAARDQAVVAAKLEGLTLRLAAMTDDVEKATKGAADARSLRASFNEMNVLRSSWLLGGGLLVQFPPTLMQFILAFTAGAFGALLITLVIAVYPQSNFSFTASDGFLRRILLGGMISLCVYIVLGGGSAILGTADPFSGGQANVMTFSAVGILAGMFSDKVALWLSARAGAFFTEDEQRGSRTAPHQPGDGA